MQHQQPASPREVPRAGVPVGRAAFLGTIAAGIAGIALAPRIAGTVNDALSGAAGALPNAIGSLAPTSGWRIYTVASPMPRFDPSSYALVLDGHVAQPRTLGWPDVAALSGAEQTSTFHCVTGWTVENVRWEGVRGRTLADLVQPRKAA